MEALGTTGAGERGRTSVPAGARAEPDKAEVRPRLEGREDDARQL